MNKFIKKLLNQGACVGAVGCGGKRKAKEAIKVSTTRHDSYQPAPKEVSLNCSKPVRLKGTNMFVPCTRCTQCKIQKARELSLRMMHQLQYEKKASFITLTYSDSYLLESGNAIGNLRKEELQKFFKRLRKQLPDRNIKYFACGEYGEKYGRPHYHAIIFGITFEEHKKHHYRGVYQALSGPAVKSWDHGAVYIGTVTHFSTSYVAKYVHKKYNKKMEAFYGQGRRQPFHVISNGIGKEFAIQNMYQIMENAYVLQRGHKVGVPKYYRYLYQKEAPEDLYTSFVEKLRIQGEEKNQELIEKYDEKGYTAITPYSTIKNLEDRIQRDRNSEFLIESRESKL